MLKNSNMVIQILENLKTGLSITPNKVEGNVQIRRV